MFTEDNAEHVAAQLNAPAGDPGTMANATHPPKRFVAYFSMEIALENHIPTYSGGLGVLAGDTIRAAADIRLPMVAVSLLYRKGYFRQRLSEEGAQTEEVVDWAVEKHLQEEEPHVFVSLEGRKVELRAWRYTAKGVRGYEVPIYFLDADLPSNDARDRELTGQLYGGDPYYRLSQEVLLGIGGVRMLRALGHTELMRYHMNEGHAALLTLELLEEEAKCAGRTSIKGEDIEKVRAKCVFTTHTPVPAGHDKFPVEYMTRLFPDQNRFFDVKDASSADLVRSVLQVEQNYPDLQEAARSGASVNMTYLALSLSNYVNGVAKLHGEVSRKMFPNVPIEAITNGFARRATGYKRADLILSDLDRLRQIAKNAGAFQIIYAGKAHPRDGGGKDIIKKIYKAKKALKKTVSIVFLDDYDLNLGGKLTAGGDLWLNTPQY